MYTKKSIRREKSEQTLVLQQLFILLSFSSLILWDFVLLVRLSSQCFPFFLAGLRKFIFVEILYLFGHIESS